MIPISHVKVVEVKNQSKSTNASMDHTKTLLSLWRESRNAKPLSASEIKEVAGALKTLQRGLTGKRTLAGAGYMDERLSLGAYLLYYFPVSLKQVSLSLESALASTSITKSEPLRILDVGSGPGPASVAALDCLLSRGVAPESVCVTLLDASASALDLAEHLIRNDYPGVHVTSRVVNLEHIESDILRNRYELVLMSHALNELWLGKDDAFERKTRFLRRLGETLAPDGLMLLCEPALLETSRELIALVASLKEEGYAILAPCPNVVDAGAWHCPALLTEKATCHAEVFCHFAHPVDEIAREAGLTREGVKMTFFALSKSRMTTRSELLVVSDAMLNKSGRIRYLLCDGKRRIAISARQGDPHASAEGFFSLSRYDKVKVHAPEQRGDADNPAWGINEATRLTVERFSKESPSKARGLLQARSRERKHSTSEKTPSVQKPRKHG